MRLLSGLVSFSELKNLQNELRCRLEPQTVLLCRRPSVGVEQWIPLEREKWSCTPGDSILSNRKARECYTANLHTCWPGSAGAPEGDVHLSESGTGGSFSVAKCSRRGMD
jgi:hypothetical protein